MQCPFSAAAAEVSSTLLAGCSLHPFWPISWGKGRRWCGEGVCEFNPVLLSVWGVSFAQGFDNCQRQMGRACSAQGRGSCWQECGLF